MSISLEDLAKAFSEVIEKEEEKVPEYLITVNNTVITEPIKTQEELEKAVVPAVLSGADVYVYKLDGKVELPSIKPEIIKE